VTASLFSTTAWTNQKTKLGSYLGLHASPKDPLQAWLRATQTLDPGAMGYWVFQANLGTNTLGTHSGRGPMLSLGSSLPPGSVIVAFLSSGTGKVTGTASGRALFDAGPGTTAGVPEPGTFALLAAGLLAFALRQVRGRGHVRPLAA
jgi:PEP-CTERM motif